MWKEGVTNGHWWQAKVHDEPSQFGIDNGRISKLVISSSDTWQGMDQAIYNYERGLDFDETPDGLLSKVISDVLI